VRRFNSRAQACATCANYEHVVFVALKLGH